MSEIGTVRLWVADEGWGVLDSTATPGGCWAHFAAVAMPGFRELQAGARVNFEYEQADQDGFDFRTTRVWPVGAEPVDEVSEIRGPACSSAFQIELD